MINDAYKAMLTGKSVIRELNEYANDTTAHPHLRPEELAQIDAALALNV